MAGGGSSEVPYLGSKISLTSNSEIRYEGILYTIDTKESTIALAKVRSFGTENRPTDRPVAPRDEVYEYIIFRGADIKEIRVCGPPKPQATLQGGLPNDPAIIQHSAPGTGPPGARTFSAQSKADPSSYGPIGSGYGQVNSGGVGGTATAASSAVTATSSNGSPTAHGPGMTNTNSGVMDLLRDGHSGNASPVTETTSPTQESGVQAGGRDRQHRSQERGGRGKGPVGFHRSFTRTLQGSNGGGRGRGGRGNFVPGRPQSNKKDTLKFDDDYDFEQANEQFQEVLQKLQKSTITDGDNAKEKNSDLSDVANTGGIQNDDVEDGEIKDVDHENSIDEKKEEIYYDKTKSFFDSISCEAVERSKGKLNRPDWRAEKKLNRETFGVVSANNGYRRGGGGGNTGGFNRGYRHYNGGNMYRGNGGYQNGFGGGGGYGGYNGGRGGYNRDNTYSNHRDRFSRDNSGSGRGYTGSSGGRNWAGVVRGGHQGRGRNWGAVRDRD